MKQEQIAAILTAAKVDHVTVIETGLARCPVQVQLVTEPGESQQDRFARLDHIEEVLERAGVIAWAKVDCVSVHGWMAWVEEDD